MTSEASPLIDAEHVADLVALDKGAGAVFRRFVDLFVSRAPERLAELERHAKAADTSNLAEAAHSMRGAAGNVGAIRLAGVLGELESAAKKGELEAARKILAALDAEYAATRAALLEEVARSRS